MLRMLLADMFVLFASPGCLSDAKASQELRRVAWHVDPVCRRYFGPFVSGRQGTAIRLSVQAGS